MKKSTVVTMLLFAYMLGALYPILRIKTEFNVPYNLAFKYLTIPLVIASFIFVFKNPRLFIEQGEIKTWKLTLFSFMFGGLITLFSGPYIALINAVTPAQENVAIDGQVTDKFLTGKYHDSPVVVLDVKDSFSEPYKFEINRRIYDNIRIGEKYKTVMRRGGLGFVYKWKQ